MFERIDLRVEEMVEQGLLKEAQWLLRQGITADTNCASRGIGYRQALLALQHWQENPADASPQQLVQLVKDIQSASRSLCKRQINWFRDDPMFMWVDARQAFDDVTEEVLSAFHRAKHPGNGGEDGRLNKTEANEVKRYQTVLKHLNKPEVQQMVLTSISG